MHNYNLLIRDWQKRNGTTAYGKENIEALIIYWHQMPHNVKSFYSLMCRWIIWFFGTITKKIASHGTVMILSVAVSDMGEVGKRPRRHFFMTRGGRHELLKEKKKICTSSQFLCAKSAPRLFTQTHRSSERRGRVAVCGQLTSGQYDLSLGLPTGARGGWMWTLLSVFTCNEQTRRYF